METKEIVSIIENFEKSKMKAILIDGAWGIGKTYQVSRYLKQRKGSKTIKPIYLSCFGFKSTDEIHTALYSKLHPKINLINKSINIVSPAISLIPYAGGSISNGLDFVLDIVTEKTNKNKIDEVKKNKKQTIIIFDDLERMNLVDYETNFLGYINQLFLNNIKVILICNYNEMKNKDTFEAFKEKIVDREYKINSAPQDVINNLFDGIDSEIIDNFGNNIRIAERTAIFYKEIAEHISSLDQSNINHLNNKTILWYASLIISKLNSKLDDSEKNLVSEKYNKNIIINAKIEQFFENDENIKNNLLYCNIVDETKKYPYKLDNLSFSIKPLDIILAFAYYYFYHDFSLLDSFLIIREDPKIETVFDLKDVFYYSEEGKKEYIKRVLDAFFSSNQPFNEKEVDILDRIFNYDNLFPNTYDSSKFINHFAERLLISPDAIWSRFYFPMYTKKFMDIYNSAKESIRKIKISTTIDLIPKKLETNNINDIYDLLDIIRKETSVLCDEKGKLIPEIIKLFEDNNYFLPNISGEISNYEWSKAHQIVKLMMESGDKTKFSKYLVDKFSNSSNPTEKERWEIFIDKYKIEKEI